MKKIILTGGGTAGHVTPNLALVPGLKENGFEVKYVGSSDGMEKQIVTDYGLEYFGISSGKLRRYLSLKNLTDPFRVIKGYFDAKKIMKAEKPDIVFSKGGFVTVPVVYAAAKYKIPVVIHESDMTPGLANKLAIRKAVKVCHNFPETAKTLGDKSYFSGCPIRSELFEGNADIARKMCGFDDDKPVMLVTGGSLGALKLNTYVRNNLDKLLETFNIAHLCGKGKLDESLTDVKGYCQFEYISEEMKDFFAMADIIVSRAGANSICEIAALKKPNLLVPLSAKVSRGDQVLNAKSFSSQGLSMVIDEDVASDDDFYKAVMALYKDKDKYIANLTNFGASEGAQKIVELLCELSK